MNSNTNHTRSNRRAVAREFIRRTYATGLVCGEDNELYRILPAALTQDRGAYLTEVCRETEPATTVEIGMAWGLSTFWILTALLEHVHPMPHVVMDPFQHFGYHGAALRALRVSGLDSMIEFYEEPSITVLEMLALKKRQFDFAFIDGDHSFDAVLCDLWLLDPLIRPGGVIVFDDVWSEDVQRICLLAQELLGYKMRSEHLDPNCDYRPLMRTYVKSERPDSRRTSDVKRLAGQFRKARTRTLNATNTILKPLGASERKRRAQSYSTAGLQALGRGEQAVARLNFYYSLRYRPFKLRNYGRLARTFLPLAMVRVLSGSTVRNASGPGDTRLR